MGLDHTMSICRFVKVRDKISNGTTDHPAVVNRVWGDGENPTINVMVFPDCGEPYSLTSIQHRDTTSGTSYYAWPDESLDREDK